MFIFKVRRRTEASGAGLGGEGKEKPWLESSALSGTVQGLGRGSNFTGPDSKEKE